MSAMRGQDRARLRAEAHELAASVHVGAHGVSNAVVQSLDDALRTGELVKVKLGGGMDANARDTANDLAARTGAEVIQVIGRTFTLFRQKPEPGKK